MLLAEISMAADSAKSIATTPLPSGPAPLPVAARQRLQQLFERGKQSFERGDFPYAYDMFAQCVVDDPGNVVYLQHFRANLQRKHGERKKGGALAALKIKRSGRSAVAKHAGKGEWPDAFRAGCEVLKNDPWDVGTLIELAAACEQLHLRDGQLYFLRWALDVEPKDLEANRAAAAALAESGEFDQAISCWRRVLEVKPADPEATHEVSRLSVEKTLHVGGYNQKMLHGSTEMTWQPGGTNEVIVSESVPVDVRSEEQRLMDAIQADPAATENYLKLAELCTTSGRLPDAERALAKALQVSGGGDLRIRELWEDAQLRRLSQQVEIARRRAAEDGTPDSAELSKRMLDQAQQSELEIFAARAARDPNDANTQFEFAMRAKRVGKHREAIQAFQVARNDRRRLAESQLLLGECFQHIEQYKLAMTSYEAALQAADRVTQNELYKLALYRAGVLATGLKDLDRAEKHLSDLAGLDFGYRDVADRLDKIARLRKDG
jgi:tetratricopeptide (TPR) repeat protein